MTDAEAIKIMKRACDLRYRRKRGIPPMRSCTERPGCQCPTCLKAEEIMLRHLCPPDPRPTRYGVYFGESVSSHRRSTRTGAMVSIGPEGARG